MGSCGTKLQKEHECSNILPTQKHHSSKNKKSIIILKQSQTAEIRQPKIKIKINVNDSKIIKPRGNSTDSCLSSSFERRLASIDDSDSIQIEDTHSNSISAAKANINSVNSNSQNIQSIQNEPLINLRFNRTLFCEDITYEYAMNCNFENGITDSDEIIPQWILRLTVEKLTKFYAETLEKYVPNNIQSIPYQFGKVMKPKLFTSLLNNILQQPNMLKDKNEYFSETTANFLNIPYDIRSIIQYSADRFIHTDIMSNDMFKYYEIILSNDNQFKYLSHAISIYKHDYEYDDCCQCYDEPQITCYSYWVRSFKYNIDFLFNITSNNIFYIIMNDLSYNISQILINYGFDSNSAWIITDYLPKYLLFNHKDEKCNSQIIYKYDPRNMNYDEDHDTSFYQSDDDEEYGQFLLEVIGNKLLQRHNITNIDELHTMCQSLRIQHTSIPPSLPEMSPSLSEYIINHNNDNPTHDNDNDIPIMESAESKHDDNIPMNNIWDHRHESSTIDFIEESIFSSTNLSKQNDEKCQIFFSAFIDEEGEDDINLYQWMQSLQKIGLQLSEKEIVNAFNYMLKQNEDSEGYIDFVDFTKFCNTNIKDNQNVKRTQELLNNFIKRN